MRVHSRLTEERIDIGLGRHALVRGECWPIEQRFISSGLTLIECLDILEALKTTPNVNHVMNTLLDELHRTDDLADALTCNILEVTGFEDADHLIQNLTSNVLVPTS